MFMASIRPHYWRDLYKLIEETNKCSFKLFFCGPQKPDFELPENLVYIHSDMTGVCPCIEIARRHAIKSGATYMMLGPTDDCILTPGFLDVLIDELKKSENGTTRQNYGYGYEDLCGEIIELVVGVAFRPTVGGEVINAKLDPSGLGIMFPMMKRSTAIKMGPLDKRFIGVFYERDLYLRLCDLGVDFKTCSKAEASEDMSKQDIPSGSRRHQTMGARASREWHDYDMSIINSLWRHDPSVNPVNPYFPAKRIADPILYEASDLSFTLMD